MSIKSVTSSNHLIFCHRLLLLPSIFPNRVFSNESALCIKWSKYWNFSFSISPSNEYSGLISFRIDLLDLLPVQGPLKSLIQHHSSKASILQCSAFFTVQLSHPYVKNAPSILRGITLNLYLALGKMFILTILILPIHEHSISFHLSVSSSVSFISVLQF